MDADRTRLRVGRLTKAHGLKGALKLELFTDDPDRRFAPGSRFTLQVPESSPWHGRTLEIAELRWYNRQPVGFFVGVEDRTAAESLAKAILWIEHDEAEPAEDNAWYDHQLVGLAVLRDGERVGTVARVDHFPAQDLLAVRLVDREVLIPFVAALVPAVDIEAGTVTVTPPPGLFEDLPADPEDEPGSASTEDEPGSASTEDEPDSDVRVDESEPASTEDESDSEGASDGPGPVGAEAPDPAVDEES